MGNQSSSITVEKLQLALQEHRCKKHIEFVKDNQTIKWQHRKPITCKTVIDDLVHYIIYEAAAEKCMLTHEALYFNAPRD